MKRRSGKPLTFYPSPQEIGRLLKRFKVDMVSGCWEWQGKRTPDGYGKIQLRGKEYRIHRISFEVFVSQLIDAEDVHHGCRNRRCGNPDHLYAEDEDAHREDSRLHRWFEFELCGGPFGGHCRFGNPTNPDPEVVIRDREGVHRYAYADGTYTYAGVTRVKSKGWKRAVRAAEYPSRMRLRKPEKVNGHGVLFGHEPTAKGSRGGA